MANETINDPRLEEGVWTTDPESGELVPDYESTFPTIEEGQVVNGTVVRVDKDEVLVDIGYKSEGVIPVSELSIRRSINPEDEVSIGDDIAALVLTKEDEGLQAALRLRWGERVFQDGEVDRAEIGRIVFADRAELAWLESELHPRVRAATDAWLIEQTADVAVAEIPLLYETGGEARFDRVVVVTAPPELREARRGAVADREDRLVPEDEKVRRADFSFVNDGSLEELDAFVAAVLEELRRS
jgi:dephospho-CoA kinase